MLQRVTRAGYFGTLLLSVVLALQLETRGLQAVKSQCEAARHAAESDKGRVVWHLVVVSSACLEIGDPWLAGCQETV